MDKPLPIINPLTKPYWDGIARGKLTLQRCLACDTWIHFPEHRCPACQTKELDFAPVSGRGEIESFSVIHRSFVEGFGPEPYVIAWVSLVEQAGLRILCNIIDCDITHVAIGMPVSLRCEKRKCGAQEQSLPQFTLCTEERN